MNINDLFEYRAGHSLPPNTIQLMDPDPVDVAGNPNAGDFAGPNAQFQENSQLPPRVVDMIQKISACSASPEHKKAAIEALIQQYQQLKLEEESLQGVATSYDWQRYQNKEGQLRKILNQPRNYATQNYTGTPTEGPEDSEGPDLEPFYTQMKHPVSAGARFDKNFASPNADAQPVTEVDTNSAAHESNTMLDLDLQEVVKRLREDFDKAVKARRVDQWVTEIYEAADPINEATAQSIYQGLQKVFPNLQSSSLLDLITQTVKPLIDMGVKGSRSAMLWIDTLYNFIRNTPDAKVGPQNYRALEQAALRNDPKGALEILALPAKPNYRMAEAKKKSITQRNPVAHAAQRVAKGSGTHKSKKSYQRQPKHRNR